MSKEGFTSRWSRLKQQEREEKNNSIEEHATDLVQQQESLNQLGDADMPALDSLNESSDYSGFLSEKVTEAVRKAALRKMFHLPAFNIVDGLDDYAEDYTNFEALGDIVTHDMKRMAKLDAEREEKKRLQAEAQQQAAEDAQDPVTGQNADDSSGHQIHGDDVTAENHDADNEDV
ncbi:MAG: DUF3306 domain-containing protein [Gammaproteobacteria bacterium]|nr:DUF3306 domain-containing protein [Gammaproteobacteria bacterium]